MDADASFRLNRKVVSSLCVALAETVTKLGPAFLEDRVELVARIAVQVLEQKAMCQQDPDQDESEEAPEDSAEYDSILISAAGDLVAAIATATGPNFAGGPYEKFAPLIMKYYVSVLRYTLSTRCSVVVSTEKEPVPQRPLVCHRYPIGDHWRHEELCHALHADPHGPLLPRIERSGTRGPMQCGLRLRASH